MTSRRSFLLGLGATLAAPAIVRAESLMKLYVPKPEVLIVGREWAWLEEMEAIAPLIAVPMSYWVVG